MGEASTNNNDGGVIVQSECVWGRSPLIIMMVVL